MKNWTTDQFSLIVAQWDNAIEKYYPEHLESWRNPDVHFKNINTVWNLFEASKIIDWNSVFVNETSTVLDMGTGTGWLSAYLSTFKNVDKIYALDSSKNFLSNMVPEIIERLNGKADKIEPVEGLFSPIMFDDESIDVVVASSALHHAENLEDVLSEINRVLKKDGTVVILNETPASYWNFLYLTFGHFVSIAKKLMSKKYTRYSKFVSSSYILYDPYLGDKLYPLWYWKKAFNKANFNNVQVIDTKLYSKKNDKKGLHLKHFLCKKDDR